MMVCAVVLLVNHLDNKEPFRHLYIFKHVLKNNFVMFINAHLVEQELLTLPEHLSSPPGFRVTRSLVLYVCFVNRCLSFVLFIWPLCCLFFFDIQILIAPLVSSNSS
jgi:hypothetical protein